MNRKSVFACAVTYAFFLQLLGAEGDLAKGFLQPPPSARPWVYWMWMDGNLSREGITADLEAMQRAGIGGVIIMEVNVGVPQGPVKFMGPEWRELFKHVAAEAARLGIEIDLNASPGWTGSGGPWVKPEQSMQKLVCSATNIIGPQRFEGALAEPEKKEGFYRDVAVLAFPKPSGAYRILDIAEKALYHRGHYSSEKGVRPSFVGQAEYQNVPAEQTIKRVSVIDLTAKLDAKGTLRWDVPAGEWTILRFGRTSTGANTRPAPEPGLGLECDKLDKTALDAHFHAFIGMLMADIGTLTGKSLVSLHIDSWEMGPQNWTARFREEFQRLRGYDPLPYLPVMTGRVLETMEISERFLWDLRQTVQDLIVENHARHLKALAHKHGMRLAIEPYDGTPGDDLTLGAVADVPMCEFWLYGFNTSFTCAEATSIAHTYGQRIVAAEAFTSSDVERWKAHPGSMKIMGDWAFCAGVNRFVFHRYQHQPWLNRWPGMTMGPYGVHHERTQTWWEKSWAYHAYLARCQFMLQQGLPVADICYLSPEGAPNVFHPPATATRGTPPDRLGYNFDGCTPEALLTRMAVKEGKLLMPDGMSYQVLVLPERETMTPQLLRKIQELVQGGATVIGSRPQKSPSLSDFPNCDRAVANIAEELWGPGEYKPRPTFLTNLDTPLLQHSFGNGRVLWPMKVGRAVPSTPVEDNPLQHAKWIWRKEGNPAVSAPVGTRYFRRIFTLLDKSELQSARAFLTADNAFELWINGQSVGSGENFTVTYDFEITQFLQPGANMIAVAAANGGDKPNPAGLIASVVVKFRNGRTEEVPTDAKWEAAKGVPANWTSPSSINHQTLTTSWSSALELGLFGMAPWGKSKASAPAPEDYVSYDLVAGVLKNIGVPPDFESDAAIRYTHRRDGDTELYFLANPDEKPLQANCIFRVSDKQPELWDPLTSQMRMLPEFNRRDARTTVPLRFEPAQSFFVVFRQAANTKLAGRNFSESQTVAQISGPWEVAFDPKWGGPEKVSFEKLDDWTSRPEAGIRYYSGTATYRQEFNAPELPNAKRLYLDLGTVKNLAQVWLNGRDLGVVWCAPWRVEISGALKPTNNRLQIEAVNLWPNRLIGDEQFPPDCEYAGDGNLARWPAWLLKNQPRPSQQRLTFTTWKHFSKNTPLLPSGLLGPVSLQVETD